MLGRGERVQTCGASCTKLSRRETVVHPVCLYGTPLQQCGRRVLGHRGCSSHRGGGSSHVDQGCRVTNDFIRCLPRPLRSVGRIFSYIHSLPRSLTFPPSILFSASPIPPHHTSPFPPHTTASPSTPPSPPQVPVLRVQGLG